MTTKKTTNKNQRPKMKSKSPVNTLTDERRLKRTPSGLNFFLNRKVIIVTIDSKRIEGILAFISTYDIMIEQLDKEGTRTGTYMTLFKHALKYVRCEDPN
ncbi:hypothetical protein ACKO6X_002577 [Enterococcus hirae]|uniref:hypothetical protein n=1 Tax=Enterococcus hirae TaxID=1354 RepID=UPI000FFC69E6|nr:hypothetical protein [Enterococcus hirae]EMF0527753.1 hypothetical protein [Enterococcus hirae]RXA86042.1 hypothetical protein EQ868_11005 [Enterococcus hirae]